VVRLACVTVDTTHSVHFRLVFVDLINHRPGLRVHVANRLRSLLGTAVLEAGVQVPDVVRDRFAPGQPVREPAVRLRVDEVVGFGAGRDPGRDVGEAVHADRAERRGQLLVRGAEGLELAAVDVEATGYGVAVEDLQDR